MKYSKRFDRRAFCWIDLLIVIAIIATLVGFAVSNSRHGCGWPSSHRKAQQDLEVVDKAITLYDEREATPLPGPSLAPLLGRYMQEIPHDPWGNEYIFDANLGILASLGADALPGGSDNDRDVIVYRKPAAGAPWARELFALHPSTTAEEARREEELARARAKFRWF